MRANAVVSVFCVMLLASSRTAFGQQDVAAAARAYSRAQAAELTGESRKAAELYELANHLVPSPEALRGAIRTRRAAGDLAAAATLAELLEQQYEDDAASRAFAEEVINAASRTRARVKLSCDAPCTVSVDGLAVAVRADTRHIFYLDPGNHGVEAQFENGRSAARRVEARQADRITLEMLVPPQVIAKPPSPTAPAPAITTAQAPAAPASGGLPSGVFWVGVGATAALAGTTVWSGLDVRAAHADYVENPTEARWEDGLGRQRRTNILLGATCAAAAATVAIALFTDWSGGARRAPATAGSVGWMIQPTDGGAVVRGAFSW